MTAVGSLHRNHRNRVETDGVAHNVQLRNKSYRYSDDNSDGKVKVRYSNSDLKQQKN